MSEIILYSNKILTTPTKKVIAIDVEGCLSFPDVYGAVKRYEEVTVSYINRKWKLMQQVIQEEHFNMKWSIWQESFLLIK